MSQTESTVIARHTTIKGELHADGQTVIAGRVEGTIVARESLEISADGVVEGDIRAALVDIHGTLKGDVVASRACRLGATARVTGELRAANLAIAEGARFVGQVNVGAEDGEEAAEAAEGGTVETVEATINRLEASAAETGEMAAAMGRGNGGAARGAGCFAEGGDAWGASGQSGAADYSGAVEPGRGYCLWPGLIHAWTSNRQVDGRTS